MRHCPNRDCPHRRRFGAQAEYADGFATCSDCGAALVDGARPEPVARARPPSPPVPRSLWARAGVTVLALAAAWALRQVPLPGVLLGGGLGRMALGVDPTAWSVLALGVMPFLSASLLVEMAAAIVPRWRPLRHGGPAGRSLLARASLATAAALAMAQAWFVARWLDSVAWSIGAEMTLTNFVPIATVTLAAGSFALIALARLIDRRGLGNGIALMIAVDVAAATARSAYRVEEAMVAGGDGLVQPFAFAALIGAVVAGTWWMSTVRRQAVAGERRFVARVPTAGIVPLQLAASLLALPMQLAYYLYIPYLHRVADVLQPGSLVYAAILIVAAAGTTPLLARAFHRRETLAAFGPAADSALGAATAWSIAFVTIAAVASFACARYVHHAPPILPLIAAGAVGVDLAREWTQRKRDGDWTVAWPLHRVWQADVATDALAARGIPSFARGAVYRSLFHFFAPWAPVEILVPAERAAEAQETIARALAPR